jgi:hypothetical protein
MSIDPRFKVSDNLGYHPCVPPMLLGRALDRLDQGRGPTLWAVIIKSLANIRRRLAQ